MIKWLAHACYDFPSTAAKAGRPQLVTISYSHYNELARWSLELDGADFDEHGYAPGQHVLPALSVRVPKSSGKHLATSSSMSGKPSPTALPVLVLPDGSVHKDSWEIAAATSLAPVDPALREVLDMQLGVAARKLAYMVLLKPEHAARFTTMCTEGRHWLWRCFWHLGGGGALRGMLAKAFPPGDAAALAACVAQLEGLFAPSGPIAAALSAAKRAGHVYLGGSKPGQADIALAAFGALCTLPDEYGGPCGTMGPHFRYLLAHDAQLKPLVMRFRDTDVGRHIMLMYSRHRLL